METLNKKVINYKDIPKDVLGNFSFNLMRGDKFIRMIGGEIPEVVIVGDMDDTYIWVGSEHGEVSGTKDVGWKFRRDTSTEVDEEMGFDGITATISYLIPYRNV